MSNAAGTACAWPIWELQIERPEPPPPLADPQ